MSEQREKIEHPSWCAPQFCTAPEFRPTELEKGTPCGQHMSAPVVLPGAGAGHELLICLTQSVAPWGTGVFLRLNTADGTLHYMTEFSSAGQGFDLVELLVQPVADLVREFPRLYGERLGHFVGDTTSSGAAAAEILDAVGRRISATASTGHGPEDYADEDQAADEPAIPDGYFLQRRGSAPRGRYQLTVNDAAAAHGTFQEIRSAVAELVTGWLADDPEGLALDAQTLNLAFNSGSVQAAIDERGEWSTTIGVHSAHATMRIKVTRA